MVKRKLILKGLIGVFIITACARQPTYQVYTNNSSISIDSTIVGKQKINKIIGPYKAKLDSAMDEVIGYSDKELVAHNVESDLTNFVADLMLTESRRYFDGKIDMGAINVGGLRATLPAGKITLEDVYELMPFENTVNILELNPVQMQSLMNYLAARQNIALSNTLVIVKDNKPLQAFVDGSVIDENKTYRLAISDYLAHGGDDMTFLEDAKCVKQLNVKVRDLIIEKIRALNKENKKVEANVEGRVKLL